MKNVKYVSWEKDTDTEIKKTTNSMRITAIVTFVLLAYPCWRVWSNIITKGMNWNSFGKLSVIVFFLSIGGLTLTFFWVHLLQLRYWNKKGVSVNAEAEIVRIEAREKKNENRHGFHKVYFAIEEIHYQVGERTFTIMDEWEVAQEGRTENIGDKRTLTIRYDPNNPEYTNCSVYNPLIQKDRPFLLRVVSTVAFIMLLAGVGGFVASCIGGG